MTDLPDNDTRTLILNTADELFSKRGYAAVTLRDIASAVGMRHASLYYYAPGGKEQLFIEVMERNLHRHKVGLAEAVRQGGDDLRQQIYAISNWLASQPPMDLQRLQEADTRTIGQDQARRLMQLAYNTLRTPVVAILKTAKAAGLVRLDDLDLAAMALISLVQSVHSIPGLDSILIRQQLGRQLADMLLDGWLSR